MPTENAKVRKFSNSAFYAEAVLSLIGPAFSVAFYASFLASNERSSHTNAYECPPPFKKSLADKH